MDLQRRHGFEDTIGGQLRALFETWVHAMWVLLEPDIATREMISEYKLQVGKMDKFAGLELAGVEGWAGEAGERALLDMARRVGTLLAERQTPELASTAVSTYHLLYRNESHRGTHGGLGALAGHVHCVGERMETLQKRAEPARSGEYLSLLGASLTGHLAQYVFDAFHVRSDDIEPLVLALRVPRDSGISATPA
jgi:hypothetical protein